MARRNTVLDGVHFAEDCRRVFQKRTGIQRETADVMSKHRQWIWPPKADCPLSTRTHTIKQCNAYAIGHAQCICRQSVHTFRPINRCAFPCTTRSTCMHAYIHACTHAYIQACIQSCAWAVRLTSLSLRTGSCSLEPGSVSVPVHGHLSCPLPATYVNCIHADPVAMCMSCAALLPLTPLGS